MENQFTKEWLVTNGIGGFASSTIEGANTRRYHGLLVASLNPPTDRKVIVAKVEERIFLNGNYIDLSTNNYSDIVYPQGYTYLKEFNRVPFPKWVYQDQNFNLEKEVLMVAHENATLIKYINKGNSALVFEIHPLHVFTDYHTLFHENGFTNFFSEIKEDYLKVYPYYESLAVFTKWTKGHFIEARDWYKNIFLPMEANRGLDYTCDYFRMGYITCELQPHEELTILFTLNEKLIENDISKRFNLEKQKLSKKTTEYKSKFYKDLLVSGHQFLVKRDSTNSDSIIAGYHWFTDWGRDTMIAMRGLTIATGNQEASKSILSTFLDNVNQGMIPNRFPDHSEQDVEYNTVDATLWLFVALYDYYKKFNDLTFVKKQIVVLQDILDWHMKGTRYNIHVTPEGFLYGGQEGLQLTWMDAMVNGVVITPRIGCPVEINALWYNALRIFGFLSDELQMDTHEKYKDLVVKMESNFVNMFINDEGTLYDVIVPHQSVDNCFRPNQIYCLSLPFTLLAQEQKETVFKAVKSKLWTPYGLRTLDEDNPKFESVYFGNQWQRDHTYHQGTVWPYLLGAYYDAFFKIYGDSVKNKKEVIRELQSLKEHFYNEFGIHCISEVFDGKTPKQGKGTIQQAWSVSALIKLYSDYKLYDIDD